MAHEGSIVDGSTLSQNPKADAKSKPLDDAKSSPQPKRREVKLGCPR